MCSLLGQANLTFRFSVFPSKKTADKPELEKKKKEQEPEVL